MSHLQASKYSRAMHLLAVCKAGLFIPGVFVILSTGTLT